MVALADDGSGCLPCLREAIDGARATGIPVICVRMGLRPVEDWLGAIGAPRPLS